MINNDVKLRTVVGAACNVADIQLQLLQDFGSFLLWPPTGHNLF